MIRIFSAGLAALLFTLTAAHAQPERYLLDAARSEVRFTFDMDGTAQHGTMPVTQADVVLDLADMRGARVAVAVDVRRSRTGLIFATEALKGASLLDANTHPEITFRTRSFARAGNGLEVTGDLTLRGVTRPITLRAVLFQTAQWDGPDRLAVQLTGAVDRFDFGAAGYPDLAGAQVALRIRAFLTRAP